MHCVGALFESCGSKIGSYFIDTTTGLLKIVKNVSEQSAGLIKVEAIRTIGKIVHGSGKNAPDQSLKEIVKYMKNGLCDKSFAIRIACAECLREVASQTTYLVSSIANDLDILLLQIFKAFEGSNYDVRREIASLAAVITATTQSPVMATASTKGGIRMAKSVSFPSQSSSPTFETGSRRDENGVFSIEETLAALSSCFSKLTTRESRVGIIETYSELLLSLGSNFIEANYAAISKHIIVELVGKNLSGSKLDILCVQEWCSFLLRDIIGKRLLSEQGQVLAVRELTNTWIKPWESNNPSKYILRCVLNEVNGLVLDLGGVASSVQDSLIDPLVTLLGHTSHTVQIALASCFRSLCYSLPAHLPKLISKILKLLQRTIPTNVTVPTSSMGVFKKCLGLSQVLCALITLIPEKQLYISHELYGGIFSVAVRLLKNATSSETQHMWISSVEYRVGWSLIGSLMCIGPQFSQLHMSQLMILWRNSLPKMLAKDANRGVTDWLYMLQIREVALGALYSFLIHNGEELITTDAAKRITQFLDNTLAFLALIPSSILSSNTSSSQLFPCTLDLTECENLVRKRLFECYSVLKPTPAFETSFSSLLKTAIELITEPEFTPDRANTASTMGNAGSSIFQGYGCGMNSSFLTKSWDQLYTTYYSSVLAQSCCRFPKSMPSIVGVTDSAIDLITIIFPYLSSSVQEFTLEQLWKSLKNPKLDKSPDRKIAVQVNAIVVLLKTLENLERLASKRTEKISIPTPQGRTTALAKEILQSFLPNSDPYVRCASGQALGLLAQIVGNPFITSQIQYLVDVIVNDRDPNVRSGCVIALSCIYNRVGGIAANVHLKTVVGILHSLSSDSHPTVHSWALKALSLTIDSAGSMFAPYVNGTIGVIAKVFMSEGHEQGYHSLINPPFGMAQEVVYQTLGHLLYALIGTLGPELQAATKVREICLCLIDELKHNDESLVVVEYIKCVQHLLMFAPNCVDISSLIPFLQDQLYSFNFRLKSAAVTCLYQLVQRNVKDVLKNARPGLREQLFFLLDDGLEMEDAKRVIKSHLSQTVIEEPLKWFDICKKILSKTSSESSGEHKATDTDEYGDDSVAFTATATSASASGQSTTEDFSKLPSRWRAQLFALDCLREIVILLAKSDEKAHFDMVYAKETFPSNSGFLVFRLPELIKMSFVAATSSIIQIRLDGLSLLSDIIKHFAATTDPDFEEAMILEQYQAQITSALAPAFSTETAPEVITSAIQVCGDFIASNIVREIGTLGRMVKLLTTILSESSVDTVNSESPDGKILVKITTLKIWAELFVLSRTEEYLLDVIEPRLEILCELWLLFVQDYAKVRLGATGVTGSNGLSAGVLTSGLESIYGSSVIGVILPYYESAWIPIMNAISVLIDTNNDHILTKLRENTGNDENYDTPSRFFFVLLGLCVEALAEPSKTRGYSNSLDAILVLVKALRSILKPLVAGNQCLEHSLFMEIICVLEKLMIHESNVIQVAITEVFKTLATEYSSDYLYAEMSDIRFVNGCLYCVKSSQ
ncbi:ARM repeat-containing protein [Basidiobolus meristosporus CBS 931.73]|uniref:ARM repeat-containing protein n=1 Tax=Basidiobolus meristosporus CBS 931.73 TaxID=1314790 RepID=A0A1Y1YI40_9FUNG|nr:ARM repeat-containing protein [Basidiobolus meristosporus CBS 931.73]|eukprot:ORX97701.1 ARM repeat-containing protein [Basidiobolus meristosporus CBS 931.73]